MKVLVLSNFYPPDVIGGYELAASQAADGLLARGHDVRVLTAVPRLPVVDDPPHVRRRFELADEWDPNAMGDLAVTHLITHAASRFVSAQNVFTLTTELAEFEPDVVYLHSILGLGGLGILACLARLGVPWVWQLGDCLPNRLCASRKVQIIPALANAFSKGVEGSFIVVSEHVRREIEAAGIALRGAVEVIPNWVVGQRLPRSRSFAREGFLRVVSAGQVNRDKGVDLLIEAAGLLRDRGHGKFSVDIYGRAADGSFAELARGLGLDGFVRFQGMVPHAELATRYGDHDVLAFPTQPREPFGLVALEAAARGCVPLMTRDCGVAEWLVHGVHCLKCDRSAQAIAETLAMVLDGRVALGPIARRAEEAVWRDFHLDAVLPRIEAVLERAAERTGRRPRIGPAASAEVYRLARLAERLAEGLIQEQAMAFA